MIIKKNNKKKDGERKDKKEKKKGQATPATVRPSVAVECADIRVRWARAFRWWLFFSSLRPVLRYLRRPFDRNDDDDDDRGDFFFSSWNSLSFPFLSFFLSRLYYSLLMRRQLCWCFFFGFFLIARAWLLVPRAGAGRVRDQSIGSGSDRPIAMFSLSPITFDTFYFVCVCVCVCVPVGGWVCVCASFRSPTVSTTSCHPILSWN